MNKPHKHAEVIKAWADGAEIELWCEGDGLWLPCPGPSWDDSLEYRVKPHPWQHCIDAQRAGKVVQAREPGDVWEDGWWVFDLESSTSMEYRIKPEMVRFRSYLFDRGTRPLPALVINDKQAQTVEGFTTFVRWLGDWQEVEL